MLVVMVVMVVVMMIMMIAMRRILIRIGSNDTDGADGDANDGGAVMMRGPALKQRVEKKGI